MSKMKVASGGRNFSARAIWSTVVGETADSLIFFPIAFGGLIAWPELLVMMGTQIVLKSLRSDYSSDYHPCRESR